MDNNARDKATNRHVSFNNEATSDAVVSPEPLPPPLPALPLALDPAPLQGGLYCNWTMMMRIPKKRKISTEREMIIGGGEILSR